MKKYLLSAFAIVALLCIACGGDDDPTTIPVMGIKLDKTTLSLGIGDKATVAATITPADATNKAITWSSANQSVATVSNGVVTGVAAGETTITAKTNDGGFTATVSVEVVSSTIAVTGITLDKTSLSLEIGETATVVATVEPEDATNKSVVWSSADESIATVEDGVVEAVAAGETTITAKTEDGDFEASVSVSVAAPNVNVAVTGVKLDKTSLTLEIGEKATVVATVEPEDATNKSVVWSSADESIATIEDGVVEAVATGETTITAKTEDGDFEASVPVKVLPKTVKVTEIKLVGVPAKTEKGRSTTFSAVITPADATDMSVTFTSSNPEVATVEFTKAESNYSLALLKAVGNGKATITATANDGSGVKATAEVEVVGVEPTALTINGKTEAEIYTWHGNTVELDIATTPAGADLTLLNWQFTDPYSEFDVLQYSVTSDKVTIDMNYPKNNHGLTGGYIKVWSSDYSALLATVDVYCQTLGWLFSKNPDGSLNSYVWPFSDVSSSNKFSYNMGATYKSIYFTAFYYTNGKPHSAIPSMYYADYEIPNSAYTLTSSAPDKLKVTREADGKGWKLERLDTTSLVAVTLTYTCGRHTQTYTINLIP